MLSSGPRGISIVGPTASSDPLGAATFVVRDLAGNPVPGSVVTVDFSNCSDLRLAGVAPATNVRLDCTRRTAYGIADANGAVTLKILGSGAGTASRAIPACATVLVDGVPLPPPIVAIYDLDGVNGIDLLDLSLALRDVYSGQYRARSDYDFDGKVDLLDLCVLARAVFSQASTTSGSPCAP